MNDIFVSFCYAHNRKERIFFVFILFRTLNLLTLFHSRFSFDANLVIFCSVCADYGRVWHYFLPHYDYTKNSTVCLYEFVQWTGSAPVPWDIQLSVLFSFGSVLPHWCRIQFQTNNFFPSATYYLSLLNQNYLSVALL